MPTPLLTQINIPPHSGGYFSFGHSPNITGCAQVRFLLACQPCISYLPPVNGFYSCGSPISCAFSHPISLPCVMAQATFSWPPANSPWGRWHGVSRDGGIVTAQHFFPLLSTQSPTALRAEPPLHKGAFRCGGFSVSLKRFGTTRRSRGFLYTTRPPPAGRS